MTLYRSDGTLVHRFTVSTSEGSEERVEVVVDELPPVLDVASTPSGAEVRVNGMLRGRTPVTVAGLEPGRVRVDVRKRGCTSHRSHAVVSRGTISVVDAELRCPP